MLRPFVNQPGIAPGLESQASLSFAKEFYEDFNQIQMTGALPCDLQGSSGAVGHAIKLQWRKNLGHGQS